MVLRSPDGRTVLPCAYQGRRGARIRPPCARLLTSLTIVALTLDSLPLIVISRGRGRDLVFAWHSG